MSTSSPPSISLEQVCTTRSTGMSLNDRFTKIKNIAQESKNETRIRNAANAVVQKASLANQLLVQQLQRKHKMMLALKLKRKSLRAYGIPANQIRRGTVKALRVGANGKPVRMNSLTNIATMKADHEIMNGRRPIRRANSSSSLTGRLGSRRLNVGGAVERVAMRRLQRQRFAGGGRSRLYLPNQNLMTASTNPTRSRSRSRVRSRSRSRVRNANAILPNSGRSRSSGSNNNTINNRRSRSRARNTSTMLRNKILPIKARLGVRNDAPRNNNNNVIKNNQNYRRNSRGGRNTNVGNRGVMRGRVNKKSTMTNQGNSERGMRGRGRRGRSRQRSAVRNNTNNGTPLIPRSRSRSRSRAQLRRNQSQVGLQIYNQKWTTAIIANKQQNNGPKQRRGVKRQQWSRSNGTQQINNNNSRNTNKSSAQQNRLNRSRSRSRKQLNGGRGNNDQGTQQSINKDELDKELDQYMATTKTENNVDYLLKR